MHPCSEDRKATQLATFVPTPNRPVRAFRTADAEQACQSFQDGSIVGLRPTEALPAVGDTVQIKIIVYLYGYFYEKLLI